MSFAAACALYELRTYSLRLDRMAAFLRETERLFHLRTQQSPVLGYWTSELGGLHQVVHLWPYESLSHRASVRAALASDTTWLQEYVGPVLNPAVLGQDNLLMRPLETTSVTAPTGPGVTELLQLSLTGPESEWSPPLLRVAAEVGEATPDHTLVGCFRSVIGPANSAVLLTHYPSQEALLKAAEDRRLNTAYVDLLRHVRTAHSKLLLPHKVSLIQ
ncbi:protein NipSnap homolog 3A-like isoform X2 [Amphibalanus amphitrite]|uniref:protein NipSnap homolog 3A-like isoform X2 n=1 Tax=Amphibalanus amphitrite TaxID=1232801 RepID=UPI001C906E43|nr:protein NipSnap homolog 3A-like isoform X2 [Amphibalanus amphitrite]XP_043202347.1 protein NipSnap homolog 3A-like isoform X2 [Amphibalanus amphitrite]